MPVSELTLLALYTITCPRCRAEQTLPPSSSMREGINSGCTFCKRCRVLVHWEVSPDLDGHQTLTVLQVVHAATIDRLMREAYHARS